MITNPTKTQMLLMAATFTGSFASSRSEHRNPCEGPCMMILSQATQEEATRVCPILYGETLCYAEEPAASQDVSKTRLNTGGVRVEGGMISQSPWLSASVFSTCWLSLPHKGFTESFPFAAFLAGVWLQKVRGQCPLEPAPGFTLPWVERSCAQCGAPETAGTKLHNTPTSGRCTPRYVL
jgi:hypothetical protein